MNGTQSIDETINQIAAKAAVEIARAVQEEIKNTIVSASSRPSAGMLAADAEAPCHFCGKPTARVLVYQAIEMPLCDPCLKGVKEMPYVYKGK